MVVRRARSQFITGLGLALLALIWSQAAHAQVKLEYKFPESKTLKYKTNSKITHILTLAGQEFETKNEESMVRSRVIGIEACRWGLADRGKSRIHADRSGNSRRHQRDATTPPIPTPRSTTRLSRF